MPRLLPAFVLAILLGLAGAAAAHAQTATPRPMLPAPRPTPTQVQPIANYETRAAEQLGNLSAIAGDMLYVSTPSAAELSNYNHLLINGVGGFVRDTTPPAEFAAFHTRLGWAVNICELTARVLESQGEDVFWFLSASMYAQACRDAAGDALTEWAHATGKVPFFSLPAAPVARPTARPTTAPTPAPAATPAAALPSDDGPTGTLSQTVEGVTVEILSLEVSDFGSFSEANTQLAGKLAEQSDFTPAAAGVLSVKVTNRSAAPVDLHPAWDAAVVVAGEQIDLSAYRFLNTNNLDTSYYPDAFKSGTIYFALPRSAWEAIEGGARVGYYIDSYGRDYAIQIAPTLP